MNVLWVMCTFIHLSLMPEGPAVMWRTPVLPLHTPRYQGRQAWIAANPVPKGDEKEGLRRASWNQSTGDSEALGGQGGKGKLFLSWR